MRGRPLIIVLALCCAAPDAGSDNLKVVGGRVTGRVALVKDGKPVPPTDVFVYVEETRPKRRKEPLGHGRKGQISQKGEDFLPHALVVPVGTEVAFPNLDFKEHNVFSSSDPPFDLGRYNHDAKGKTRVFMDPGEMEIYCDIHQQMAARVKVVESAWIARVGTDGSFAISGVPAGTYVVVAWAPDSAVTKSEPIVVTEGATLVAEELHVQLGSWKKNHLRKDGTPYPCPPGYPKC